MDTTKAYAPGAGRFEEQLRYGAYSHIAWLCEVLVSGIARMKATSTRSRGAACGQATIKPNAPDEASGSAQGTTENPARPPNGRGCGLR